MTCVYTVTVRKFIHQTQLIKIWQLWSPRSSRSQQTLYRTEPLVILVQHYMDFNYYSWELLHLIWLYHNPGLKWQIVTSLCSSYTNYSYFYSIRFLKVFDNLHTECTYTLIRFICLILFYPIFIKCEVHSLI